MTIVTATDEYFAASACNLPDDRELEADGSLKAAFAQILEMLVLAIEAAQISQSYCLADVAACRVARALLDWRSPLGMEIHEVIKGLAKQEAEGYIISTHDIVLKFDRHAFDQVIRLAQEGQSSDTLQPFVLKFPNEAMMLRHPEFCNIMSQFCHVE